MSGIGGRLRGPKPFTPGAMRPSPGPGPIGGITGNSGGGTMTTWLCGVEDRWTMAAPSCFVTTFRRNLENELPAPPGGFPPELLEGDPTG